MYLEKGSSPGQIINLDHVASMDWDKGLSVEFVMANGQTITWQYDNEDGLMEDLDKVSKWLDDGGMLVSVDLDQE